MTEPMIVGEAEVQPVEPSDISCVELTDAELEQVAGGALAVGIAITSYVAVGLVAAAVVI